MFSTSRSFRSFRELSSYALGIQVLTNAVVSEGLLAAARTVHKKMTPMFGEYQSGVGPFADWAPLTPHTQDDRVRAGYPADEPLLREGELRDSYEVQGGYMMAGVGSSEEKALVQEIGDPTHNLPARSTLGIAFVRAEKEAFTDFAAVTAGLFLYGKGTSRRVLTSRSMGI